MSEAKSGLIPYLRKVSGQQALNLEEARQAFELIMSGGATPSQIAGFLMALRMRGESVEEITAAVEVIRSKALPVAAPAGAMDIVGTGGDGKGTLNISTATALVVAGCGVPVAKHGNRALSSKSGAADVLSELGVNLEAGIPVIEQAIREAGFGFMLAPRHHDSFRYVGPVRVELGIRTMFNILGPLCNPAGVKRYMLGVYAPEWVAPLCEVLSRAGADRVWVVHGAGGLDELSTLGVNQVSELSAGQIRHFSFDPADHGLARASMEDLQGGDGRYNAQRLSALLAGQQDAYRDVVLLNAAASLLVAERVADLDAGIAMAAAAIDAGDAARVLEKLTKISYS